MSMLARSSTVTTRTLGRSTARAYGGVGVASTSSRPTIAGAPTVSAARSSPVLRRPAPTTFPRTRTKGRLLGRVTGQASDLGASVVVLVAQPDLVAEPHQRVVLAVDHALLHRDDRVVGDLDALGAHLGAALGDVAHPAPGRPLGELATVVSVQRVHVEL